jgi:uncharacterized membrane protein
MILTILTRVIFGFTLIGFVTLGVYLYYMNDEVVQSSKEPAKEEKEGVALIAPIDLLNPPKEKKVKIKPISYLEIKKARQQKALKVLFVILGIILIYFAIKKFQELKN